MALTVEQFKRMYNPKEAQDELYRQADIEVNGREEYYEKLGKLVEESPIVSPHRVRRG